MIDTSEYEGHLPFTGEERVWVWSKSGMKRMESVKQFNVTAQLLEDAPALLAEVVRLQGVIAHLKQQGYISVTPNETEDEQQ